MASGNRERVYFSTVCTHYDCVLFVLLRSVFVAWPSGTVWIDEPSLSVVSGVANIMIVQHQLMTTPNVNIQRQLMILVNLSKKITKLLRWWYIGGI